MLLVILNQLPKIVIKKNRKKLTLEDKCIVIGTLVFGIGSFTAYTFNYLKIFWFLVGIVI